MHQNKHSLSVRRTVRIGKIECIHSWNWFTKNCQNRCPTSVERSNTINILIHYIMNMDGVDDYFIIFTHILMSIYVCMCVCMYMCVYVCNYVYVCMCVCVCYVSMHISDSLYRVAIAARRPFTKIQQSSCSFITMMDRIKLFPNLKTLINAEESTYMWNTRQMKKWSPHPLYCLIYFASVPFEIWNRSLCCKFFIFSVLLSSYTSRLLSKEFYRKKVKDNMFICSK